MSSEEVSVLASAQPSSTTIIAAETPTVAPSSVYVWTLSGGWDEPVVSPGVAKVKIGMDTCVSAKSDTHPDVVADLIAEFMTDTVLRIDSEAAVDIHVAVKEDLIMVTGQVGCSHPAKSAIIHSDQFLSTLNSSIRDLLRDLGFGALSTPPATLQPSTPPTGEKSPKKLPQNASGNATPGSVPEETTDTIDPTNVHVIIALTPCEKSAGDRVTVRARAGKKELSDLAPAARSLVQKIAAFLGKTALAGGVIVELSTEDTGTVSKVSVGIDAPLTEQLLGSVAGEVMSPEYLTGLTPLITRDTLVEFRQTERTRATGTSCEFAGKDWNKPARYGHVAARQEAVNLVKTGACEMCEVTLTYAPNYQHGADASLAAVAVNAFGTSSESTEQLAQIVLDRLQQRSAREVKESILKDANATLFSLNRGGSVCNHEFVTDP